MDRCSPGRSRDATRLRLAAAALVATLAALPAESVAAPCVTPLLDGEPLCNPAVADSEWPISHRGAYAQGSSPFAGPDLGQAVTASHLDLPGPPITLAMSPAYLDGHHVLWAAVLGLSNAIVKVDAEDMTLLHSYVPANEEVSPPAIPLGVSGSYSVVDRDGNFLIGRAQFVEIYADSVAGDRTSPIALVKRVFLPAGALCRSDDLLVGGVLLPDGHLALVTEQAVLSVIPSSEADMDAANVVSLPSENGADCANLAIASEDLETVSNSIAADEHGGIYVVSDRAVIKYRWDGTTLQKLWRTEYRSDEPYSVLRLGPGSGSTPSLMGTEADDDRFVVVTDGQELMHLVLMWRDEIPGDWQPIAPGRDPRIACEVPVHFGSPNATRSLSEQSVLVRGHASVVVSNLLKSEAGITTVSPALSTAVAALYGGNPLRAPKGAERIDWDPVARTCNVVWTNTAVSLPNAIPTMSAATGLMHAIGQRDGAWGLETLDFETGESLRFDPGAQTTCSQAVLDAVAASVLGPFLSPVLEDLPASCENSFFAATEVGADGAIFTGTFQGVSRFVPDAATAVSRKRQGRAGAGQGVDLAARGVAALPADVDVARDMAVRGQLQAAAAIDAVTSGTGTDVDAGSAAAANALFASAAAHFAAAETAVDVDVPGAVTEFEAAGAASAEARTWLTPCPPSAQTGCRVPSSAAFSLKLAGDKGAIQWRWKAAEETGELPDPRRFADYALCVYEDGGTDLAASAAIPVSRTLWQPRKDGLLYKDKLATRDGITKALLREKPDKPSAKVVGKGASVPVADLPLAGAVVVQLVNSETALCWEAAFAPESIRKNEAGLIKAAVKN